MAATPFKINIPNSELELLQRKVDLTWLPNGLANKQWGEDNGVTLALISETIEYWRKSYDWRAVEASLNELPQYKIAMKTDNFGTLDIHFVHSSSTTPGAIPVIFLHGWPGSFAEVQKILPKLNEAGFHVVAPSLPGYGFSSYPDKAGWKFWDTGTIFHQLMLKLGYEHYVAQGGDWDSLLARFLALTFPDNVKALYMNASANLARLDRLQQFSENESSYSAVQAALPFTLGLGMHDSPIAMLSWMADKLFSCSDAYPWTSSELITWTLLHYFPGPTIGFMMYHENNIAFLTSELRSGTYVKVLTGISAFPKEIILVPRVWAEVENNVQFWEERGKGGHFAAWERPEEFAADLSSFFSATWKKV